MKAKLVLLLIAVAAVATPAGLAAQNRAAPELLLRLDDIGMSHSVNLAMDDFARTGIPFSASVMFATPWYQEAAEILRRHPHVSVGVHLTLNSEWKNYRWGPVLGMEAVPSLVDTVGYFHPSTREFLASDYDLAEVERELSAQVERALRSGLRIDYVDYHMGTAVATPMLREVVERVADRYGLAISRYFGEENHTMFDTPVERKTPVFLSTLAELRTAVPNLMVIHVARPNPEMEALLDQNNAAQNTASGAPLAVRHRAAELEMLLSPEVASRLEDGTVRLVTYADLMARHGLAAMRRP